ncbi:protein kinase [Sorangium sp. So ce185]|uniref:serine/threonine-protein kinase n=1 Tax=Sorangium sp. So ce185 TaxID=3133287 RepID=UPI003F62F475
MELLEGQHITPNLRLVRPVGQGGMGSVWAAEHRSLGALVAVKFIQPDLSGSGVIAARFKREAMAAAQIKSPHVVQVFDYGLTGDGTAYMVMELLEGEDLGQRVRRAGPLTMAEVATVVRQVSHALARAHPLGIVHRDIKPDNVFLTEEPDGGLFVKLLDFGIAKQGELSGATSAGAAIGTPVYASPEQLDDAQRVDIQADLWSLAVTTYYALFTQLPFNGATLQELRAHIALGAFTPPSELSPDLPAALDVWFERAFSRSPAGRFLSALQMAIAFEVASGAPADAAPARSGRDRPGPTCAGGPRTPQPDREPPAARAGERASPASAPRAAGPLPLPAAKQAAVCGDRVPRGTRARGVATVAAIAAIVAATSVATHVVGRRAEPARLAEPVKPSEPVMMDVTPGPQPEATSPPRNSGVGEVPAAMLTAGAAPASVAAAAVTAIPERARTPPHQANRRRLTMSPESHQKLPAQTRQAPEGPNDDGLPPAMPRTDGF